MTPATRLLKKHRIDFEVFTYDHDTAVSDFGNEAVNKLGLSADEVFKTLLVDIGEKAFVVAIVSMNKQLCLKRLAAAFGVKKAVMADKQKAQTATGYLLGGISPLGQKKVLRTVIDSDAQHLPAMYVSGGKRGLEIKLSPMDLATLLQARFIVLG